MTTKERILEASRLLFNTRGAGKVSARVICEELNISPGNFTYYYPNKNHVTRDLFRQMNAEKLSALAGMTENDVSILPYLTAHRNIFEIQLKYRFFYLSLFEILTNNPEIRVEYLAQSKAEVKTARENLDLYVSRGVLIRGIKEEQFERIVNEGRILNNSWLVDAEVLYKGSHRKKMQYYMSICCGLLEPYLTDSARKQYENFFRTL